MQSRHHPTAGAMRAAGFTDDEIAAVFDLAFVQDLTPVGVLRQALRLYQLVAKGHATVTDRDPPVGLPGVDDQQSTGVTKDN